MNNYFQKGFSLIEVVVAIVMVGVFAVGFLSAFSLVLKNSTTPQQLAVMEDIAASQMDYLLSGLFESAVAQSNITPQPFTVGGFNYAMVVTGQSAVVSGVTVQSGLHLTVNVCADFGNRCVSGVSLSGDTFYVQ